MDKKVAIIIPFYNTEEFLSECLDSIVNQTMKLEELEVIMINDGSKDNSLRIANKYKKRYPDWTIISQKNKGLSAARNRGLEEVTAEYFCFLDSDDYYNPKSLEKMYKLALSNNADMVISKIKAFDTNNKYDYHSDYILSTKMITDYNNYPKIITATSVCSKLFKSQTMLKYRFIIGVKHEDCYYTPITVLNSQVIAILPEPLYQRRYREGESISIMQNLDYNSYLDLITNYTQLIQEINYDKYILKFCIKNCIFYIIRHLGKSNQQLEGMKKLTEFIKLSGKEFNLGLIRIICLMLYSYLYFSYRKIRE